MRSCGWVPASRSAGERHDKLGGGHAVHRDGGVGGVAFGDPRGELGKVEVAVVQDALARCQAVHTLTQLAAPVCLHQLHDVGDFEVRGGVGDAGDAELAETSTDLGQAAFIALQRV